MLRLWRRHSRFLVAFAAGVAAGAFLPLDRFPDRLLIGADLFFISYLVLTAHKARSLTPDVLRHHAQQDDEGIAIILSMAILGIVVSLWSALALLSASHQSIDPMRIALAVAAVPLGWATIHTVMALHYAHMHYARGRDPGLDFPGMEESNAPHASDADRPGIRDFIYFSFTIGMTAQTADVGIRSSAIRKVVTLHGALSFFYNTVILALTVSAAANLAG